MNQVIPALMLFRAMALQHHANIDSYTVDAHTSTGYDATAGTAIAPATKANTGGSANNPGTFGQSNLQDWISGITSPY